MYLLRKTTPEVYIYRYKVWRSKVLSLLPFSTYNMANPVQSVPAHPIRIYRVLHQYLLTGAKNYPDRNTQDRKYAHRLIRNANASSSYSRSEKAKRRQVYVRRYVVLCHCTVFESSIYSFIGSQATEPEGLPHLRHFTFLVDMDAETGLGVAGNESRLVTGILAWAAAPLVIAFFLIQPQTSTGADAEDM